MSRRYDVAEGKPQQRRGVANAAGKQRQLVSGLCRSTDAQASAWAGTYFPSSVRFRTDDTHALLQNGFRVLGRFLRGRNLTIEMKPSGGLDRELDPERLMARVRLRDAAAFEAIYDGYHRLVFGIGLRMLGDVQDAEDLTQSVFLTVWSAPDSFVAGNLPGWFSRVTRNRALDVLRRRSSHAEVQMPDELSSDGLLEESVAASIEGARVRAALSNLPRGQRDMIELGFFTDITHEEIARSTGTPLGTVKTRIRTGLSTLRVLLDAGATNGADARSVVPPGGPARAKGRRAGSAGAARRDAVARISRARARGVDLEEENYG